MSVTSSFTDQLSDLLDQLLLLDSSVVIVGDFNAPGEVDGLYTCTADMFTQYGLRQRVSCPLHRDANILHMILSQDNKTSCNQLISDVAAQSVCFSDHLLTCRLGVPPTPPVMTSFSY